MAPSQRALVQAERVLRRRDKALRLRYSLEQPGTILIERKTFVGRIGATLKGKDYAPDAGYRREVGHVSVGALTARSFDAGVLREALEASDSWRGDRPTYHMAEAQQAASEAQKRRTRQDLIRYKTQELWSTYVTKYKQRVYVPAQVS